MKCHICGSEMVSIQTDLPFKVNETTTVLVKALPVLHCQGCGENVLEDGVMQRVEESLERADVRAQLQIIRYASWSVSLG